MVRPCPPFAGQRVLLGLCSLQQDAPNQSRWRICEPHQEPATQSQQDTHLRRISAAGQGGQRLHRVSGPRLYGATRSRALSGASAARQFYGASGPCRDGACVEAGLYGASDPWLDRSLGSRPRLRGAAGTWFYGAARLYTFRLFLIRIIAATESGKFQESCQVPEFTIMKLLLKFLTSTLCCGTGSVPMFLDSWIWIRIRLSVVQIRILLSSSKNT
jgi:hypothetical protein